MSLGETAVFNMPYQWAYGADGLKKRDEDGKETDEYVVPPSTDLKVEILLEHVSKKPEAGQEGKVVVVKPSTFPAVVLDPGKDVLVEFMAPWCERCTALDFVLDDIAKKHGADPNIGVAKFDV